MTVDRFVWIWCLQWYQRDKHSVSILHLIKPILCINWLIVSLMPINGWTTQRLQTDLVRQENCCCCCCCWMIRVQFSSD